MSTSFQCICGAYILRPSPSAMKKHNQTGRHKAYLETKDKPKEKNIKSYKCRCGATLSATSKYCLTKHRQTKKHQDFIKSIESSSSSSSVIADHGDELNPEESSSSSSMDMSADYVEHEVHLLVKRYLNYEIKEIRNLLQTCKDRDFNMHHVRYYLSNNHKISTILDDTKSYIIGSTGPLENVLWETPINLCW